MNRQAENVTAIFSPPISFSCMPLESTVEGFTVFLHVKDIHHVKSFLKRMVK